MLGNHGFHVQGQVHQYLIVLFGGEKTEDPVDGLVGIARVQRAQAQVSGLGKGQRLRHGLCGAYFTDENHVRRLAQGVLQPDLEGLRVQSDLALGDQTALVIVHEFDGIFDRQDVFAAIAVTVPDHGRQRGRLARARGAQKHHQAAFGHRQVGHDGRQTEFIEVRNLAFDAPQHQAEATALNERAGPKAAVRFRAQRVVTLLIVQKGRLLRRGHTLQHQRARLLLAQVVLVQGVDFTVNLQTGRGPRGDETVRGPGLHNLRQQLINGHGVP